MTSETPETVGVPESAHDDDSPVMDLLGKHVPLSLIMDLSTPAGPDSEFILDDEGQPEDAWWEPAP
jgi:hypothetical protein